MVKVINNYSLIQFLGEGAFGEVHKAVHTDKNGFFAVKAIPLTKLHQTPQLQEGIFNQITTLSSLTPSPHIVKYEEHFQTRNNLYLVYQFCEGGNLQDLLRKKGPLPEKQALIYFQQLLQAFKVLNRFNVMHRDLKPQNIFLGGGMVKLGDFGFCKGLKPGESMTKTMLGSPIYMAPQVLRGQNYTSKADVWSLGVVLYQMLFGVCPFQSNSIASLINNISRSQLAFAPCIQISERTKELLKRLLTKDYFRRISWIELFAIKIDEEGNYSPKSTNYSTNFVEQDQPRTSFGKKITFYSQKFMNLVTTPHSPNQNKTSLIVDPIQTLDLTPNRTNYILPPTTSERSIADSLEPTNISKRPELLKKHGDCLSILKQTLNWLETRQESTLVQSFKALQEVHSTLKEISGSISAKETQLLDVASLINYQLIQIDRQMIQTRQQIMRRKLPFPRNCKVKTMRSIDDIFNYSPLDLYSIQKK